MLVSTNQSPKIYFDFTKVFTKTKQFVDNHNFKHIALKDRLNSNHRATAELITRLYTKQLNNAIQLGNDVSEELPPFTTYNPSLASCKGCTVRTIINHKERLKASGFIIKEEHRGKTGIALWINPEVFSTPMLSTKSLENQIQKQPKSSLYEQRVKNLPPLVHEQQEQKNNNSSVDKLITQKEERIHQKVHNTNHNSVTGTYQEQNMNTRESRPSDSRKQIRRTKNSNAQESESAFLLGLVKDFWNYSKAVLYPDKILSEPEEREILNQIWASVYRKFKVQGSQKDWEGYQEILYKRIDMVARYLERNPNRWVAPPHLYFHPENKRNGFAKTYNWFLKQETLKREIRNQILIQKTDQEWKDHKNGKGKHKHKSRLQLFRIQQQRLSTYKDDALLSVYQQSLQRNLKL
ncbi:hypothetical protein [uncultured Aquimarina sp.]|uniref:hypothetical protein n=1 Tax=uncultured Aquimarina sp. TaxID=575652 RepID=UPI002630D13A|nr:hypothetical protein [uncultured Aquimarina sp.]